MSEVKTEEAIPQDELRKLVSMQAKVKEENGERSGEYGEAVKAASEKYGVNKKALGMICSLNRMTQEKRDDVLRSLDNYRALMGYDPGDDLVDQMEAEEEDKPQTAQETVHQLHTVQ
ncbi:MAG: hypothetical protein N4A65_00440 [Cohaesibacter sp.]|jgi:uncharacterized protein (UPF0335 family)|nr:hypothetical protein [Cohaesibacter sp.]